MFACGIMSLSFGLGGNTGLLAIKNNPGNHIQNFGDVTVKMFCEFCPTLFLSKVIHVPSTFPDIFKTKAMLDWEYASQQKERLTEAYKAMQEQLNWLPSGVSDYEIAIPIHELEACASATS